VPKYQPGADLAVLERAYRFSERSHRGQQRASGQPYLSHPLEVASLLVAFKMDVTTVTAGLLHDVLEDTGATKAELEREFGKEIAELVDGVTKLGKLAFSSREERQAENFRKMLEEKDRKSTRLNSSHVANSYAVFCLKKKIHAGPNNEIHTGKEWNYPIDTVTSGSA